MSIRRTETLGELALTPLFPAAAFERVNQWMSRRAGQPPLGWWFTFASAWNAVAYRLKGAAEHSASLAASCASSTTPPSDERFRQDHDLFVFATSAASAIECCCFAAYFVAQVTAPGSIKIDSKAALKTYPPDVLKKLQDNPTEFAALAAVIASVIQTPEYERVKEFRDVLSHRGTPPRLIQLGNTVDVPSKIPSNSRDLADNWKYETELPEVAALNAFVCDGVYRIIRALDSHCGLTRDVTGVTA